MFNLYPCTPLSTSSAYLLVSHGSRDPRPGIAIATLRELVQQQFQVNAVTPCHVGAGYGRSGASPEASASSQFHSPPVATAVLECAPQPLHEQIGQFAALVQPQGIRQIQILPLFLLPGVHVKQDIPEQVAIAQQRLGATVELRLCPFLGAHARLPALVADRLPSGSADAYILLSHGSRREGGNAPVEALAQQLGAVAAYWSVEPSLAMQVQALVASGKHRFAIFPYFMFPGGIGDAIAQQITQLKQQWPSLELTLMAPLAPDRKLAQLVVDLTKIPSPQ